MSELVDLDLSIVVPAYNAKKYINRCVDSLLAQDGNFKYEIILVNDGSTDGTKDICEEYKKKDNKIKVIHKKNGGLSSARNAGLKLVRGEYVGFVDSDDWVSSDMYSYLLILAKKYRADIVSGGYYCTTKIINLRKKTEKILCFKGEKKLSEYLRIGLKYSNTEFSVCNKVYHSSIFQKIEFPEGQIYEDMATNLKLFQEAKCWVRSNQILYYYFDNKDGITASPFSKIDYESLEKVGYDFIQLAKETENPKIIALAKAQSTKLKLSGLRKIILYGVDDDISDCKAVMKEYEQALRRECRNLVLSPMRFRKKIQALLLTVNAEYVAKVICRGRML